MNELFEYIARDNPDAAFRFLSAAQEAFQTLLISPDLGSRWETDNPHLAAIRVWHVGKFRKHLIFYRTNRAGIEIIRILYGTRDIEPLLE